MALTNRLQQVVDLPVFEWMRFAPTATAATSGLCCPDDNSTRFMYYLTASTFYRYDTISDSWQLLASPNTAPVTAVSLKYSKYSGHRGKAIAGGAATIELAGASGTRLVGQTIRIVEGTGAGQERTITAAAKPVVSDFGVVTSAAAASIGDSTKKWRFNQWKGYQVRLTHSTGQTQIRKVLYNDTTTLYFNDVNYQASDPFNNTGWSAVAPYAVPVTTAGSQTNYVIESSVATVGVAWDVVPDNTSIYLILSGGIFLISSAAATPFTSFQWYDILADTWYTKTAIGGHLLAAYGTDFAMERVGESGGAFTTGTSSGAGTSRTLVNSGAGMTVDRWANFQIRITGGTGIGQRRRIVGNNATTFWVEKSWVTTPDATSTYSVYGDTDKVWLVGGASSLIYQHSMEYDLWSTGPVSDGGIARNASAQLTGVGSSVYSDEAVPLTSIVRTTTGITAVAVNAAGTNYVVGDLVTCSTGGTLGTAFVTSVGTSGAVTGLQLAASGSGYSAGSSNTTGGAGSGLTITLTVGTTGLVTTAINHNLQAGNSVTMGGFATDTSWNAAFTVLGVGSLTTYSVAAAGSSASPTIASSQAVGVVVDASKSWIVNEHVGNMVSVFTAGPAPTTQMRRITANTATTLTLSSNITAATNGTSRYNIQGIEGFGAAKTNRIPTKTNTGWATSGSATTLVDSTKSWNNNQWLACRVRVISGTGIGNEAAITGNTATTLTVASWPNATPDTTSKYIILDAFGIPTSGALNTITDTAKNWTTNILAGRRVRIIGGTLAGTEAAITSNTATALTTTIGTPDATSIYTVYEPPAKSTGVSVIWLYGLSDTTKEGNYLFTSRGGASNAFDLYDITTNSWVVTPPFSGQSETLTTGSMFTYDGADSIIFMKDATGRIFELDMSTYDIAPCTTTPYAHGAAVLGNRMEIVSTADGLEYLYVMRHTGQELWRTLKFW
jgi:hypothetical protein